MHRNICNAHQVHYVDEQKQRLTKVWRGLGQSVIDDAMYEWHKRLLLIFCISQGSVVTRLRCGGK